MAAFSIKTEAGKFSVRHIALVERVCELFEIACLIRCDEASVDLEAAVGKEATVTVSDRDDGSGVVREWTGIVRRMDAVRNIQQSESKDSKTESTYRIFVVPKWWLATQNQESRIFQKISIPEIVDLVLAQWGVEPDWTDVDRPSYPKFEYKTQYGESDFAFVTRLLEEAGIAWLWATETPGEKLVFSDRLAEQPPRQSEKLEHNDTLVGPQNRRWAGDIQIGHEVRPGHHALRDFDFRNPRYPTLAVSPAAGGFEGRYERFDYLPGSFLIEEDGPHETPAADAFVRARYVDAHGRGRSTVSYEAGRTGRRVVTFESNVIDVRAGSALMIEGHPHVLLNEAKLLVTEFSLEGVPNGEWKVRGEAYFAKEPFRPALRTRKPSVHGVQSATVTGPAGDAEDNPEIHTDEFGRVRVQFPWAREQSALGGAKPHTSCWLRVSQGWAGASYGMVALPRVDQEVIVAFLGGDPDHPMVVGRAFNNLQRTPYELPNHKTQSGWRTSSSPQKRAKGQAAYNELKFEDDANQEFVYIQAQRDLHQLVKHNEVALVKRHHVTKVEHNQHDIVVLNRRASIGKDEHLTVGGNRLQKVEGSVSVQIEGDQDVVVKSSNRLQVGREIHIQAGDKIVIHAARKMTLTGPGGSIDFHDGGIDIQGRFVKINSGIDPASIRDASPTDPKLPLEAKPWDESAPDEQYDEEG